LWPLEVVVVLTKTIGIRNKDMFAIEKWQQLLQQVENYLE
jgi:hypothetical protein